MVIKRPVAEMVWVPPPWDLLGEPGLRVRVGIITPSLTVGGAERHLLTLLTSTRAALRWVGVAVTQPEHLRWDVAAEAERTCPVGVGWTAAAELTRRCDVLVTWGIPRWWERLPAPLPCPVVLISHGSCDWTRAVLEGCERAAAMVAVSRVALEPLSARERARAVVIPNGVDPERVRPRRDRWEVRREWGLPENGVCERERSGKKPDRRVVLDHWTGGCGPRSFFRAGATKLIGYLGRFSAEKDCEALIRAVAALPEEWRGAFVGRGWEEPALRERAERQCPGRILFPGVAHDVGSALGALDWLLLPSRSEGFGLVIAEAWLAGVPVVCTPVGIALEEPELVRTVPFGASGPELAAAFLSEAADPLAVQRRVERARQRARERYTAERFGREWTALLCRVSQSSV